MICHDVILHPCQWTKLFPTVMASKHFLQRKNTAQCQTIQKRNRMSWSPPVLSSVSPLFPKLNNQRISKIPQAQCHIFNSKEVKQLIFKKITTTIYWVPTFAKQWGRNLAWIISFLSSHGLYKVKIILSLLYKWRNWSSHIKS